MYHGNRLWVLLQARGVLCELRAECQVDFTDFKALMSLALPDTRPEATIQTKDIFRVFDFSVS